MAANQHNPRRPSVLAKATSLLPAELHRDNASMTAVYHITHLDNLPKILACGALLSDSELRQVHSEPRSIAYGNIKDRRSQTAVTLPPGGFVCDYVPFYFCPRSPMLYAVHSGQVPGYAGGQQQVVHLVAHVETLGGSGRPCLFTDGNAASQPLNFHADLARIADLLSWDVIRSWSWRNRADDNDRKRRKQAEFLVHGRVPWAAITEIGVHDAEVAARVSDSLAGQAHRPAVHVHADWYYS